MLLSIDSPMTVTSKEMARPSVRPKTSITRDRGSFETPATTVDTILVVATKPWVPKLLVTYGTSDEEACCWNESTKKTSQTLSHTRQHWEERGRTMGKLARRDS